MQLHQFNVLFAQLDLIALREPSPQLYVRLVVIVKLSGVYAKPVLPAFTALKDQQTLKNVWKVLTVRQALQNSQLVHLVIIAKKVLLHLKSV